MKRCIICDKEKHEDVLSSKNICLNCLQTLFDQIQKGGKDQKKAISVIESLGMRETMRNSILSDYWNMDQLTQEGQKGRYERGLSRDCKPVRIVDGTGYFVGSSGDIYETTLEKCTCFDFITREAPCKHIFRLSYELERKKNQ